MQKMNLHFRVKAFVLILTLMGVGTSVAQPAGSTWVTTFEDHFDGSSLNTSKWSYGFGWGSASGAFQETTRPANVTIADGKLRIKMECDNGYKSGAINSRNKFVQKYGYWEASIKVPRGAAGLLPAFWAKWNNDQWPPELDFMEVFGSNPAAQFTAHWGTSADHKMSGGSWNGGDLSTAFHTFGCEWDPDYVKWYVDGEVRRTFARPAADGFLNQFNADPEGIYMMLNIHAANYAWTGGTLSCSNLPRYMEVDYVKVFKKGTATTPPPPSGSNLIKNGEFDNGTTDWSLYQYTGTTASLAAVTGQGLSGTNAGRVYIDNGGTADWHVSLGQSLPVSSGKTYRISFMTKAGAARQVRVGIQQNGGANTLYWDEPVTVGTTAATHTFTFTAPATDATTALRFFAGGNATDLVIDKVVVTDGAAASASLVKNHEFDNGTTDWSMYNYTGATSTLAVVTNQALSGTNAAKISIAAGSQGTADWHISMGQTVGIAAGKTYQISFMSRAGSARTIRVGLQGGNNTVYWDQTVTIGTTGTTYGPYSFTANVTDATAALRFFVGGSDIDVNLDKIIVTDGSAARTSFEGKNGGESRLHVFPNPATDKLTLRYRSPVSQSLQVTLRDVRSRSVGAKAAQVKTGENQLEMDVQALPAGLYFVELQPAAGGRIVKKVFIVR